MKRKHLGFVQSGRLLQAGARSVGYLMKCCPQCRGHQPRTRSQGGDLGRAEPALQGKHPSLQCLVAGMLLWGRCCSPPFRPFLSKTWSDASHFL